MQLHTAPSQPASSFSRLRFRLRAALIEAAVEHVFGDAVFQNLDRAAGDHPAAAATHAILDQRLPAVAHRAHGLHRLMRDLEPDLIARGLGNRSLIRRGQVTVGIRCGAIEQKLRAFELDGHLGEFPLQALEFANRPAELLTRRSIIARRIERIAPERQRAGGVADALDIEARDLLLESARPEQHVFRGNAAALEMQLAPLLAAHKTRRRADRETRRATLDNYRTDAFQPGSVTHIYKKYCSIWAEGRKHLGAVDDVMRAVRSRAGDELGDR